MCVLLGHSIYENYVLILFEVLTHLRKFQITDTNRRKKILVTRPRTARCLFNKKRISYHFMCLKRLYSDSALTSDATHLSERALIFVLDKGCQGGASWRTEESDRSELWWSYKMWQCREKSEMCFCSCLSYRQMEPSISGLVSLL